MKPLLCALFLLGAASAQAGNNDVLERALRCELKDSELAPLMRTLAAKDKGFAKAAAAGGAPSYDLYRIAAPASAHGYSSAEIVVMPATIALVVEGKPLAGAVKALKLEGDEDAPATRTVRPGASILAFKLSRLEGKVLVGCRYENPATAAWVQGFTF